MANETKSVPPLVTPDQPDTTNLPNQDRLRWFKQHRRPLILGLAVVVLALAAGLLWRHFHHQTKAVVTKPVAKVAPPKPTTLADPLTGVQVSAAVAAQPVFGTIIENSPEARPQSGLSQAGVVYEALAEGGITRFLAIFQDQQPANLGPVRSLRPYFIDWVQEYNNAPIAHAGGSAQALGEVGPLGVKSMNGLIYGANFLRTKDRAAPHNLYTNFALLLSLMQRLGVTTAPSFTDWPRQADAPMATPSNPTITITYSYPLFTARYQYDAASNSYLRFLNGAPHVDRNTGKQIVAKNIAVITVPTSYDPAGHALMTTIGSGRAVVFLNGGAVVGTWHKTARSSRIQFLDAASKPIPLNAGNTWIGVIPPTGSVVY